MTQWPFCSAILKMNVGLITQWPFCSEILDMDVASGTGPDLGSVQSMSSLASGPGPNLGNVQSESTKYSTWNRQQGRPQPAPPTVKMWLGTMGNRSGAVAGISGMRELARSDMETGTHRDHHSQTCSTARPRCGW